MSNYLRKNEEAAQGAASPRNRRRLWLATGAAGLAGVVSLGAIGVAASVGAPRLTGLGWAGASILAGDGTSPGGEHKGGNGREGREGQRGENREGGQRGEQGRDGQQGENGEQGQRGQQGQNGQQGQQSQNGQQGQQGQNGQQGQQGQNGQQGQQGQNGQQGQAATPNAIAVPCNRDALFVAVNEANDEPAATLKLAKDCVYDLRSATGGTALPPVTTRLTIIGDGSVIERSHDLDNSDPAERFRFLQVNASGHLTLKGLTLRNGLVAATAAAANAGGAILVQAGGEAVIEDSTLTGNNAVGVTATVGATGGAVENRGRTVLRNSKFTLNNAFTSGGAVHNTGVLLVEKSVFEANKAAGPITTTPVSGGGGINSAGGTAVIKETRFLANIASGNGGGLHLVGGSAEVVTSEFVANVATFSGAGVSNEGGAQLRLDETTLTENTSTAAPNVAGGGGVHNAAGSTVTLKAARFTGNSAGTGSGGGVFNAGVLAVSDTSLTRNQAVQGGGIFNAATGAVRLDATTITRNQAVVDGGGIHDLATTTDVVIDRDSRIFDNYHNNCAGTPARNCQG